MRIQVDDVRLFFDVEGTKLVAEGPWMRERPTVVLLHPGPGFDHNPFKVQIGPWLAARAQVVYLDMRGGGRSDQGAPEEHRLERWADDVRAFCDALRIERPIILGLGFGAMVALEYAARHPDHPGALALIGPVARIDPARSIAVYERIGGPEAGAVAERFYDNMDERGFADFVRVCFPLLSRHDLIDDVIVRAHWRPDVLIRWMSGEAKRIDLSDSLPLVRVPTLVLAGDDDAWAPLESVREVAERLPEARFHSFPGARHSVIRDEPAAAAELQSFLDVAGRSRGRGVKVEANGIDLFFDVQGTKLLAEGPWMRERPTVLLLPTGPGVDHSLYKEHIGPALAAHAQVVYLDLRGTGRSGWSTAEHWTLDTWVDDVAAFCDALELERVAVLGTAIGGVIGLLLAARNPERVERLVLVSTVARYVHARSVAVFDRVGGPAAGEVAARYFADPTEANFAEFMRVCIPLYNRRPVEPDTIARIELNLALSAHWERTGAREYDVREDAAHVACPTLVLAGDDDPSTTVAGTEELVEALPVGLVRYECYPETGHGIFRDRPQAADVVRDFLLAPEPA